VAGVYPSFGPLFNANLMDNGRVFYCPSDTSVHYQYNSEANPWQPETANTRAGYGMRPFTKDGVPVMWRTGNPNPPVNHPNGAFHASGEWRPFPKLSRMGHVAIAADIFASPHRIAARHPKGVNAVYADGSAKWSSRELLDKLPPTVTYIDYSKPSPSKAPAAVVPFKALPFDANYAYNPTMVAIWEVLDKQ
jgi:prepilin-type processing-associated H-X9-DG protein